MSVSPLVPAAEIALKDAEFASRKSKLAGWSPVPEAPGVGAVRAPRARGCSAGCQRLPLNLFLVAARLQPRVASRCYGCSWR